MGMRRNTYQDYVTYEEMCDRTIDAAKALVVARRHDLLRRSGASNVTSGIMREWADPCDMIKYMRVSFDSRAWTGLA